MQDPRVSIIIVSWNGLRLLQKFLEDVAQTDYPNLEIILVDNASTDASVAWVREKYPEVRVLVMRQNEGFCGGNNAGWAIATGKYVALLNNDVSVSAGWLRPLVEWMETHPACAVAQPTLHQFGEERRFEYAGAAGGYLDRLGYPFCRGRLFDTVEEDSGQYADPAPIFWASGAACLIRKDAVDALGMLFDTTFFMHMEEIDLCWRLQRAGHEVWSVPASSVRHVGGASLGPQSPQKTYLNFRNNLLLLYRNLSPRAWWVTFPQRVVLDALAGVHFVVKGQFGNAVAVLRAYVSAHFMKGQFKRVPGREVRPTYGRSIVLDYFLRGRRTFSALPKDAFTRDGHGGAPKV